MRRNYTPEELLALAQLQSLIAGEVSRCTDSLISHVKHLRGCCKEEHRTEIAGRVMRLVAALIDQCRYLGMAEAERATNRLFSNPQESLTDLIGQQEDVARAAATELGEVFEGEKDESKAMDKLANAPGSNKLQ